MNRTFVPPQFPPNGLKNYKQLTAEDRRTFDRWVGANALYGLIAMVALITMAVMGSWFPETGASQKLEHIPNDLNRKRQGRDSQRLADRRVSLWIDDSGDHDAEALFAGLA